MVVLGIGDGSRRRASSVTACGEDAMLQVMVVGGVRMFLKIKRSVAG